MGIDRRTDVLRVKGAGMLLKDTGTLWMRVRLLIETVRMTVGKEGKRMYVLLIGVRSELWEAVMRSIVKVRDFIDESQSNLNI